MRLDFYSRDLASEFAQDILRQSKEVYSVSVPNLKPATIREAFGANAATGSMGKLELKFDEERETPAICGLVKGEGSDCLWANVPPVAAPFKKRNRLERLTFATQVLLCGGELSQIPCCSVIREMARGMSDRGDWERSPFYITMLDNRFDFDEYRDKVESDEMLAVVSKNFAYAYLTDITRYGEAGVDEVQKYYITRELERLGRTLDHWTEFRPSPGTNTHRFTTNLIIKSINEILDGLVGKKDIPFLNPVELPRDMISMQATSHEGDLLREYSIGDIEKTKDLLTVSDAAAAMYMYLDNALLILKNVHRTSLAKSVPTLFPGRRLPMKPELAPVLAPSEESKIKGAEWVSYLKSRQTVFGQYKLRHSTYKARGKLIKGDEKWRLFKKPAYTICFGAGDRNIASFNVDAGQIETLRRKANPVYEYEGKHFRYLKCTKKSPKSENNLYLWLEVDAEGNPLKEVEFTAKTHEEIRDLNPDLLSYTPRGASQIGSVLANEFEKNRESSDYLSSFSISGNDTAKDRLFSSVSDAVTQAFAECADSYGKFSTENVIHGACALLMKNLSDLDVQPYSNPETYFSNLEEKFHETLQKAYEDKIYTYLLAEKFAVLCALLNPDSCSEETTCYANENKLIGDTDKMLVSEKPYSEQKELAEAHKRLYQCGCSRGQDFALPEKYVQNFEYLKENFPSEYSDFAWAVKLCYGKALYEDRKLECIISESISMVPANEIPAKFADAALRDVMRELGVMVSIIKGGRLSDRPISFSEASRHMPNDMLDAMINQKERMALKVSNPLPGRPLASYSPFIVFGDEDGFRKIKDEIETLKFEDIKKIGSKNTATDPGAAQQAPNVGGTKTPIRTTNPLYIPYLGAGCGAGAKHIDAINRLMDAMGSQDIRLKQHAVDTFSCFLTRLSEISGIPLKGKVWKEIGRQNDFEFLSGSKISRAAEQMAESIASPADLLRHMEYSGIIAGFEKTYGGLSPEPEKIEVIR